MAPRDVKYCLKQERPEVTQENKLNRCLYKKINVYTIYVGFIDDKKTFTYLLITLIQLIKAFIYQI